MATDSKKTNPANLAKIFGLAAACISLLLPITFLIWRNKLEKRVDARIDQIADAGLPTSGADLNLWVDSPPDSENGALVLSDAFALLHEFTRPPKIHMVFSDLLEDQTPEALALLAQHVETNQPALAKISEGLQYKHFSYIPDYSPGFRTLLPHLSKIKESANLFAAKSVVDLAENREREFVEDVKGITKLAQTLDSEPILISWLICAATIQIAVKSTARALNRTELSDSACDELSALFTQVGATNLLPAAFIGERAMALPVFRLQGSDLYDFLKSNDTADADADWNVSIRFAATVGILDRDCLTYLNAMDRLIGLSGAPFPASLEMTNFVDQIWTNGFKRGTLLTPMLLSSLRKSTVKAASLQVSLDSARTALALEKFRRVNKDWPESLDALGPDFVIPMDPFDGKPLRYRKENDGFLLYSVDEDGIDDNGNTRAKGKFIVGQTYDLVFKVSRLSKTD